MTATAAAHPADITPADVLTVVSEYFEMPVQDLVGRSRSRVVTNARQQAMYLCRRLTDLSPPEISSLFGGRDQTAVLHAERKIQTQMDERFDIRNQILEMTARLRLRHR